MGRSLSHHSVEVRRTAATVLGHVLHSTPAQLENERLKASGCLSCSEVVRSRCVGGFQLVVPHLVNGAKESNSAVRSSSELALVYAFHFNEGQDGFDVSFMRQPICVVCPLSPAIQSARVPLQKYLQSVEGAARALLNELQPALRRVVKNADMVLEPINTILSVD